MKTGAITKTVTVSVIALTLLLLGIKYLSSADHENKTVEIYVNGALYRSLPLDRDAEIVIKDESGGFLNDVVIKDKAVFMESASCPDQICVHTGKLSDHTKMIVCLPHKVLVKVVGADQSAGAGR